PAPVVEHGIVGERGDERVAVAAVRRVEHLSDGRIEIVGHVLHDVSRRMRIWRPMRRSVVSPVFVGRAAELAVLTGAIDDAVAGEPSVVLVSGEAGVGKTRLAEEAAGRAREAGARVLAGSCIELGGEGLPFGPLADALRSLVRETEPGELATFLGPARTELA